MSTEILNHLCLYKVSGDDAETFLQGQLSNDVSSLTNNWQYAAYCTPKGRALAVFIVCRIAENFFLITEQSIAKNVFKRLQMFVMRSKVLIEEQSNELVGVFDSQTLIDMHEDFDAEAERFVLSTNENLHCLHFGQRHLIISNKHKTQDLSAELSKEEFSSATEHEPYNTETNWIQRDIADGLPRVTAESSEKFVPQMLNMDILNGMSFKKGCYTGQEIVARMHYLGKLKQRMFVCQLTDGEVSSIGSKVSNPEGKTLGEIVNAAQGYPYFTAALRHEDTEQTLMLENGATAAFLQAQPYELANT